MTERVTIARGITSSDIENKLRRKERTESTHESSKNCVSRRSCWKQAADRLDRGGLSARTNIKAVPRCSRSKPWQYPRDKTWRPHSPLPLISGHQATLVQVPPVHETSFRSKLALNFLLTDGASIGAGRWSGTIPICCRSQHWHDTAFRVGSCTLWPLGNSMYRRTNGPRLSSTYFEPIGKRIGRRAELRMFSRPSS